MKRKVVLVDKMNQEVGEMDVYEAHQAPGTLHRAISVILWRIVDGEKQVLLQKRSNKKPLWPGYWADTCSTHQLMREGDRKCATRRLREEMGIEINESELEVLEKMYYRADYDDKLSEHELDSIIIGEYRGGVDFNKDEVEEIGWVGAEELYQDLHNKPDRYATWFRLIMDLDSVKRRLL